MIRLIIVLIVLVAAAYGGLTFYYGSGDPCEMLAKEQEGTFEDLARIFSEDPTTRQCVDELWREWFDQ